MRHYRYNVRTGLTKIKTKTAIALSGAMLLLGGTGMSLFVAGTSHASSPTYTLTPWTYVGAAGDCGTLAGTPGGVISQMNTTIGNPAPSLFVAKNVPSADCSAAGATINGVSGIHLTELNFDIKSDSLCTGGSPRFNVTASDGFHFMGGCGNATQIDLGNGWTHVVIDPTNPAQAFPSISPSATINSIELINDEQGSAYIDNVSVNGQIVNQLTPATKDDCKNNGWKSLVDTNGNTFKNQGDCVSYVATKGRNPGAGPASGNPSELHFAAGNVTLPNPSQSFSFILHDNGASATDTGTINYSNPSASLAYTTTPTCVNISGNTAYFSYVIPSGNPYTGTPVVWKVVDNSPDTAGFSVATDAASAITMCDSGGFTPSAYPDTQPTSGDILVL